MVCARACVCVNAFSVQTCCRYVCACVCVLGVVRPGSGLVRTRLASQLPGHPAHDDVSFTARYELTATTHTPTHRPTVGTGQHAGLSRVQSQPVRRLRRTALCNAKTGGGGWGTGWCWCSAAPTAIGSGRPLEGAPDQFPRHTHVRSTRAPYDGQFSTNFLKRSAQFSEHTHMNARTYECLVSNHAPINCD